MPNRQQTLLNSSSSFSLGISNSSMSQRIRMKDMFFMRIRWGMEEFEIPREKLDEEFSKVCWRLGMAHRLFFSDRKKTVGILVSKQGHCLLDLLYRWRSQQLAVDIP